ncbi:MAG TPA: hypothetical protein DDW73_13360 [Rhizobium sp.]|nr:hypothetical protein [Rhizobium sp.]
MRLRFRTGNIEQKAAWRHDAYAGTFYPRFQMIVAALSGFRSLPLGAVKRLLLRTVKFIKDRQT